MDAENDNDQPNSSSASAPSSSSNSSSNNSSSSNLLGHLPMLPFMRSTDDDEQEQEADGEAVDGNDYEEPMPLQQPQSTTVAMASMTTTSAQPALASAAQQQTTMAPITTTNSATAMATSSSLAAAETTASSSLSSSVAAEAATSGRGEEPMQQHQASPKPTQHHQAQSSPPPPLSSSSSLSASTSDILQQQLAAVENQQLEEREQQLTAHLNRSDIADTIDASAVIVQPLEANADQQQNHPHLYPQEAANSGEEIELPQQQGGSEGNHHHQEENDIQLDDNDNNDFDVDLNLRNDDEALASNAAATTTTTITTTSSLNQLESQVALDTSASGSAGPSTSGQNQQTPQLQPPTTLPLLLPQEQQQQEQQQQTEESKHLPSFDHHYHNPREFHLHAHPYQHPCVYPYGYRASSPTQSQHQQQQQQSNGNSNNIMFGNNMSASDRNHGGSSTSGLGGGGSGLAASSSSTQVVDRLKLLYPNVNENETPLPRCWSPHDKCLSIGLSQNNLRVHFKGKQSNDAASVRTAHPIPPACGIYYFEVKIISKGKNGYMGIGLTAQQFRMNRLPGWDKQSYGYHGDDGNSFSSSGHGQSYGPTFTTGDIIGCCVNFVNNTCFYTKNGIDLGIAFRDLPTKLYPTVGLQTPGEEVDANFGQEPFKFDQIEDMMKQMRGEIKATIYDFPLPAEQGDPTTLLQKLVNSYLVHNGYSQTAEAFARQKTGQNQREDITSIRNRQKILKLVMSGKMGQAIEQTMRLYPGLLENNKNLWFMLKCRQFIEMINGSDVEYCPSSSSSTNNKMTHSITTQTSAPNQTSVIQSTKSYQSVNGANNSSSNGSTTTDASTSTTTAPVGDVITTTNNTTTTTTISNSSSNATTNAATIATTTINNAQNSSHITVINTDNEIKTQSNLVEHCSTSNDAPTTISKSNNDNDYLNDVEMENNSHTTNGNICKNGNTNNFNDSIDADEEMDVDVSPSVRKYSHGIERILEFGKDLSQMGQQLEKENKMTDEERQMLEDAFSLIAYSNPWASPLGWQLCPTKRETVCRALNSAILESMNYPKWPPLEYCVAHANELLKVMAQASLGACAFVNIADVFPKN